MAERDGAAKRMSIWKATPMVSSLTYTVNMAIYNPFWVKTTIRIVYFSIITAYMKRLQNKL